MRSLVVVLVFQDQYGQGTKRPRQHVTDIQVVLDEVLVVVLVGRHIVTVERWIEGISRLRVPTG